MVCHEFDINLCGGGNDIVNDQIGLFIRREPDTNLSAAVPVGTYWLHVSVEFGSDVIRERLLRLKSLVAGQRK
jgi:hypothetical protein